MNGIAQGRPRAGRGPAWVPVFTGMTIAALLAFATWQLASAGWIHGKAWLAQRLLAGAWADSTRTGLPARRPWPGADMRPVARLTVEGQGVDLFVLDSATPRALAFGPAHLGGTARPGSRGNAVLVAHRDTHFRFLERVRIGDAMQVETAAGVARYRVREATVVDRGEGRVLDEAGEAQLTLITCYPFDAVRPGTTWRYVVVAELVADVT